ncbi:MAG: extracellular solute-binding protein [Deltaproteobacteria bacterium]|nr:extracellular solute-binding protein [Deltaproteobacteria bacterium]
MIRAPAIGTSAAGGRWLARLIAVLAIVLGLIGCGSSPDGIVLWHAYSGAEREALETLAAEWNSAHPDAPLTLVAVPYDAFADKITSAVPNGNGPDLFVYSHDRIGDWAAAGVIEPIAFWVDDPTADRFQPAALSAMVYDGELWGLPLAVKCLALFYRTDRVTAPPRTTDELFAMVPASRARGAYPLAYVSADLYGHAPWLSGFGGSVLDEHGAVKVATAEAAAALAFSKKLITSGVIPAESTGPLVGTLFNEGKIDMAIQGPWFVGDIAPGVPWAVTTLPIVSETGRPASPFLSAEGVLMSARAHDKQGAFAVMQFLASDHAAVLRATRAHQIVANVHAYDDATLAADPVQRGFRAQLAHAIPIPATPAMRTVWTPYASALAKVQTSDTAPADALYDLESELRRYAQTPDGAR